MTGLPEWLARTFINGLKVRGRTTFERDQARHIACEFVLLAYLALSAMLRHGPFTSPWRR
ncbi:hypothetical protein B5K06_31485 [Rhizobium grahamii]|uniref:Uncharacterized protein n=1 Tax=Rhizobium grahamii TaxID=1120045 RepID=A0A370KFE9_9HYPH|nr:hypothetical protein B5K06_31485 [Rhizobium grahamii]